MLPAACSMPCSLQRDRLKNPAHTADHEDSTLLLQHIPPHTSYSHISFHISVSSSFLGSCGSFSSTPCSGFVSVILLSLFGLNFPWIHLNSVKLIETVRNILSQYAVLFIHEEDMYAVSVFISFSNSKSFWETSSLKLMRKTWLNCTGNQSGVCSQNACQISECIMSSAPPWQPPVGTPVLKCHTPMLCLISLGREDWVLMKGRSLS